MWEAYRDDESGEPYFYNAATNVTQWEVPDGYAIDEEGALIDLADPTSLAGSSGPRCWFDVKIGASAPRRVVFHLFAGLAPKTVDNFRALCTGEAGTGGCPCAAASPPLADGAARCSAGVEAPSPFQGLPLSSDRPRVHVPRRRHHQRLDALPPQPVVGCGPR